MEQENDHIQIGTLEASEPTQGLRSKAGGLPYWISRPWGWAGQASHTCGICSQPLVLLMQIDTPLEEEDRLLHILTCTTASCIKQDPTKCIVALRSWAQVGSSSSPRPMSDPCCAVCGMYAPYQCSKCHLQRYCSKSCQVFDWSTRDHKASCLGAPGADHDVLGRILPEYDICVTAPALSVPDSKVETPLTQSNNSENAEPYEPTSTYTDAHFYRFQKGMRDSPRQVLRYVQDRTASDENIIWPSSHRPQIIPDCPHCHSTRTAECQIMPQIVYLLSLSSSHPFYEAEFGTIVVYTCSSDCRPKDQSSILEEFVFVSLYDR